MIESKESIIETIEYLTWKCYSNAKEHGFWQDEDRLLDIVDSYSLQNGDEKDVDIEQRVITLFNNEKIALEMSELAERLECLRKNPNKQDDHCPEFYNVEIEVADLIIRAMDFAGRRNLRIGKAILAKMQYNAGRPYKHDKNF